MTSPAPAAPHPGSARLPATVVGLGLVSLLTDLSSEAIFPLLPAFLVSLGASNAFIGTVEGAADLVSNLLKLLAGKAADRRPRLKPMVLAGYGISTLARPLVAFAVAPWHVLLVRACDRVGKGVRTAPRDALIAAVTDPSLRGRAYGFHRAMDHAGAALGTLLATGLLWLLGGRGGEAGPEVLRSVFLWAAVPGLAAMVALALTPEPAHPAPLPAGRAAEPLPPLFRRALLPIALFAVANASDAFLLVKATRLGAPVAAAPLLWLVLHLVKAAVATAGGRLSDRYGRRDALVAGWCTYAVLWAALGLVGSLAWLFALTALYGISHGLVEGAERALVADVSAGRGKGTAFGAYHLVIGLAALASSSAFGMAWDRLGSETAFLGSAGFALAAAALLLLRVPRQPAPARG